MTIMLDLLEMDDAGVSCWICFECLKALLPKLVLVNNLWIGDVPSVLSVLTIPEQLLIACHFPRCYIFKLFPRNYDVHILAD
jgi:hypothetical protein